MTNLLGTVKRIALVATVLVLVVAAGVTAVEVAGRTTADQEAVHRQDAVNLSSSLATLANGYFLQLASSQFAVAGGLSQVLSSPGPEGSAVLTRAVASLPGRPVAVVSDLSGAPVALSAGAQPLLGPLVGVEGPIRTSLLAGQPGISPVIFVDGRPTVAIAVPVSSAGSASGVFVVGYSLDDLPVAAIVQKLRVGAGATAYVVDSGNRLVTSSVTAQVGEIAPRPVLAALSAGNPQTALVRQTRGFNPHVEAIAPVGLAGWHVVIDQPANAFYGPLWHANDTFRWMLLALLVVVAAALMVLHLRRQGAVQAVADMAVRDSLTGLPNRVAFTKALDAALARHHRDGIDVALLFCDLDGFKTVNDRHGHGAGDRLLVAVGDRLRKVVETRVEDHAVIARLGGDEFTVLLEAPHATPHAQHVADALTDALAQPFWLGSDEITIGVSVGVAYAQAGRNLLRDADLAMYRTKAVRRATTPAEMPDDATHQETPARQPHASAR